MARGPQLRPVPCCRADGEPGSLAAVLRRPHRRMGSWVTEADCTPALRWPRCHTRAFGARRVMLRWLIVETERGTCPRDVAKQ
eukprot:1994514-Prymnesium_polylepis.1